MWFGVLYPSAPNVVVTAAGSASALPGTQVGSVKVTPLDEYPAKGRATGGVRCQRFLKGEDTLIVGWAGPAPARACGPGGVPVSLPEPTGRRDGSGTPGTAPIAAVAGAYPSVVKPATAAPGASTMATAIDDPQGDQRDELRDADAVARKVNRPGSGSTRTAGDVDDDPVFEVGMPETEEAHALFDLNDDA